ncbi:hypothetical protein OPIT5_15735 [Opitutaceae bacterium TAV5]|nr:hypothetical protein OPIT5_15735 [Opitutaceae bacterium TAV5]
MLFAALLASACPLPGRAAQPALVVASDRSIRYDDTGNRFVLKQPDPGSLTLIGFDGGQPSVRHVPGVPVNFTGPPTCVALHPSRPLALVASSMRPVIVEGKPVHVMDTRVTLVRTDTGTLADHATVGRQPASVAFAPDGSLALVANRSDGTLSILELAGTDTAPALRERTRVALCEPGALLSHIEISHDGKRALATLNGPGSEVLLLSLAKDGTPAIISRAPAGEGSYVARFAGEGRLALVAAIRSDEIIMFSTRNDTLRETGRVNVGRIPEGLDVSRDGRWAVASCMGGFGITDIAHTEYGKAGAVYLLSNDGEAFAVASRIQVEGGPQFAVFTPGGDHVIVAGTGHRRLAFLRREGARLIPTGMRIEVPGEPVACDRAR